MRVPLILAALIGAIQYLISTNSVCSVPKSIPFALGMIEGYHNGKPPHTFWELYALYLAMNVFSSIVWGHRQGNEEVMLRHVERFIEDHEGFTKVVPAWYKA